MESKAVVLGLSGEKKGEVLLPKVFFTKYNPGLIKRAVLSIQSAKKQPQGLKAESGRDYSAQYDARRSLPNIQRTINVGHARLPRMKNRRGLLYGRVAKVSQAVGGPKAHSPKVEKILKERINKKEKKAALFSAIAASVNKELVLARHAVDEKLALPLVVGKEFEELEKTKQVVQALKKLNVYSDVEDAKKKRKIRAGKGKRRGRKYKKKKSLLIVTGEKGKIYKASRNLNGIDVCTVKSLNAELLAPGTKPGRLAIWSEAALKEMEKW